MISLDTHRNLKAFREKSRADSKVIQIQSVPYFVSALSHDFFFFRASNGDRARKHWTSEYVVHLTAGLTNGSHKTVKSLHVDTSLPLW